MLASLRLDDPAFLNAAAAGANTDGLAVPLLGGGVVGPAPTKPVAWRLGHGRLSTAPIDIKSMEGEDLHHDEDADPTPG